MIHDLRIRKYLWMVVLVVLALGERLWFDMGPNIELVTMAIVVAAMYWGLRESVLVGLGVMLVSDLIMGNTNIFMFTWSAFLIEAVVMSKLFRKIGGGSMRRVVWGTGAGIGGSLFFYLWTNFGVWFLDSWGMYSKDLGGLVYCYMNGLPFLKNSLKSSVILVPFILTAVENVDQLRTIFTCWQKRVGRRAEVFVAKIS